MRENKLAFCDIKSYSRNEVSERPLMIYGGGIYGELAYVVCTQLYHKDVIAIIDNKLKTVPYCDKRVVRSKELGRECSDVDVLCCGANAFEHMVREVKGYSERNIRIYDCKQILEDYKNAYEDGEIKFCSSYVYGDLDLDEMILKYNFYAGENNGYDKTMYLPYCVLCITSKCSLKCRNCAAFITHYDKKQDYTLAYVEENLGKVLKAVDGIMELELMGGEPFLCRDFDSILSWCIEQKKIRAIKIITNGTIMPEENTWRLLRHNKVKLVVDDYGEYSIRFDAIITRAEAEGVRCEKQSLQTWYQIEPVIKHNFAEDKLDRIFEECSFKTCVGITNGRFYHCNVAGHMNTVGLLDDNNSDYVQLQGVQYKTEDLRNELKSLLSKSHISACDYCSIYLKKEIKVAEQ